jgi:hypothetical protein
MLSVAEMSLTAQLVIRLWLSMALLIKVLQRNFCIKHGNCRYSGARGSVVVESLLHAGSSRVRDSMR